MEKCIHNHNCLCDVKDNILLLDYNVKAINNNNYNIILSVQTPAVLALVVLVGGILASPAPIFGLWVSKSANFIWRQCQTMTISNHANFRSDNFKSCKFQIWQFQIMIIPNYDDFKSWQFQIMAISNPDNFKSCKFQIMTISDHAYFKSWYFQIKTISNYNNFKSWQFQIIQISNHVHFKYKCKFQIIQISNHDNYKSWKLQIMQIFKSWQFHIMTISNHDDLKSCKFHIMHILNHDNLKSWKLIKSTAHTSLIWKKNVLLYAVFCHIKTANNCDQTLSENSKAWKINLERKYT